MSAGISISTPTLPLSTYFLPQQPDTHTDDPYTQSLRILSFGRRPPSPSLLPLRRLQHRRGLKMCGGWRRG
jgi:hypothetical protein